MLGRMGEAVKIRGMFVVARQAEGVFAEFKQLSKCRISVNRADQRDEMTITAELADENTDKVKLSEELSKRFQAICLLRPDMISFVPPGTLPQDCKTIEDNRKWD
jgi:phenylacetate-CoA ligase